MRIAEKLASSIGKGLVAGLAGTAAMTVSSTVEARLRHRKPSSAPARATAKVLGITSFEDDIARARFNDLSHWGYGTGWGIVRGLLGAAGLPPPAATLAHGAAVWGSADSPARLGHRPAGDLLGTTGDRDRRPPPHGLRRGDGHRHRVAQQHP